MLALSVGFSPATRWLTSVLSHDSGTIATLRPDEIIVRVNDITKSPVFAIYLE